MTSSNRTPYVALTIAGSDSGGGAGIQADLHAFAACGVHGCSVITAVTAQNTRDVAGIWSAPPSIVAAQCQSVMSDFPVAAVKTGMLYSADIAAVVVDQLQPYADLPLVVDTVFLATSGDTLIKTGGNLSRSQPYWTLMRRATLITPNIPEAADLLNTDPAHNISQIREQAYALLEQDLQAVLLKGGHLSGKESTDVLVYRTPQKVQEQHFSNRRIDSPNLHGTGCTLSAAITAGLAKHLNLMEAIAEAKRYVSQAIVANQHFRYGDGSGPVQYPGSTINPEHTANVVAQ